MNKEITNRGQMLVGTEVYGTASNVETASIMPSYIQSGTELAPPSGNDYIPPVPTCTYWNEITEMGCRAPKAKGTEFCIGHIRHNAKLEAAKESMV